MTTNTPEEASTTTRCVACGGAIPLHATTCRECKSSQRPTQPCAFCKEPMPQNALRCNACQAYQNGKLCEVCKQPMPKDAVKCNACDSYRNWRQYTAISSTILSLLVALVAVLSPAITALSTFLDRHSHTNFKLASANNDVIYLTVWNTGQKPSAILGGRLNFGDLQIDAVDLDLPDTYVQEGKNVIPAKDRVMIALTVSPFQELSNHGNHYKRDEVLEILKQKRVNLFLNLEESNGEAASPHDTFGSERIETFITGRMYR